ncbi:hypothetical protein [Actibacterium ureilyticum]|uniref:hypothetical protein n=1 Tax=Actibacterium ureilyticum TaxID=1590614 RepID=UPI000BAADA81|nr:hypothetical protein [Actibacterium ureilyticum]
MALFGKQFFKSSDARAEDAYRSGVLAVSAKKFQEAYDHFNRAAEGEHGSAYYNLFLLHGGGYLPTFDLDAAADNFYKAAAIGHPKAEQQLYMLEGADRAGFGMDNLAALASGSVETGFLPPILMVCASRFVNAVSIKYGATMDVIAYELDAASASEDEYVQAFIRRTGVASSFYRGGLNRLVEGSAADQITDGLNDFSLALSRSGMGSKLGKMARCTVVGHMIKKSYLGENASPLLGVKRFFEV